MIRRPLIEPDDLMIGDAVRVKGIRGVGFVESINGDHATIAWGARREIVPVLIVRRVANRGSSLDRRHV